MILKEMLMLSYGAVFVIAFFLLFNFEIARFLPEFSSYHFYISIHIRMMHMDGRNTISI